MLCRTKQQLSDLLEIESISFMALDKFVFGAKPVDTLDQFQGSCRHGENEGRNNIIISREQLMANGIVGMTYLLESRMSYAV